MNRIIAAAAIALCAIVLSGRAFAAEAEKAPEGKELFTKLKCNTCHSVDAEGVKRLRPPSKTAAHKPPDLSSIGTQHDHEWFEKWLSKTEKVDGRSHPPTFKGTKDQKAAIAAWLETMKTEAPAGATGSTEENKGAVKDAKEATHEAKEATKEAKEATKDAKEATQDAKEAEQKAKEAGGADTTHAH
jgi:cbb3-type cytochrome oxidase cytochrome c subunit